MSYVPNRIALRDGYTQSRLIRSPEEVEEAGRDFDRGIAQIQHDAILHAADRMLEVAERQPYSLDVEAAKTYRAVLRQIATFIKNEA